MLHILDDCAVLERHHHWGDKQATLKGYLPALAPRNCAASTSLLWCAHGLTLQVEGQEPG